MDNSTTTAVNNNLRNTAMNNSLQHFRNDDQGLEIIIDTQTGESFLSESGIARVFQISRSRIYSLIQKRQSTCLNFESKLVTVLMDKQSRRCRVYNETAIVDIVSKLNPKALQPFIACGIRLGLHALAGFQVSSNAIHKPVAQTRSLPSSFAEALRDLATEIDEHEQTKLLLEVAEEKADKLDRIERASGLIQIDDFARVTYTTFGMGRNNLIKCLRFLGIYVPETSKPYQRYLDSGYFCDRIVVNGIERIFAVPRLTGKGVVWLESYIFERLEADNLYRFSNAKSIIWRERLKLDRSLVKVAPSPKECDFTIYSVG